MCERHRKLRLGGTSLLRLDAIPVIAGACLNELGNPRGRIL